MIELLPQIYPRLIKKIKKQFWNILSKINIDSYNIQINNSNLKISVNPKDDNVGLYVYLGNYEHETRAFASKFLRPGDKAFDIGANIGYFSLLFSSLVGENGEVHSFEPSQREFLNLCYNVRLNHANNIYLNQFAISNQSGYSKMNILDDSRFGAYNSIDTIVHPKVNTASLHSEIIRTIRLDDYLTLLAPLNPSLVKIDVEGFEKQVIEGARNLLSGPHSPCIIVEVCETTHSGKQRDMENLLHSIEGFGYQLYNPDQYGNLSPFIISKTLNCIAAKPTHIETFNYYGIKIY